MDRHRREAARAVPNGPVAGLLLLLAAAADAHGSGGALGKPIDRLNARQVDRWSADVGEASARFGIPKEWIRRVMRAESGGRTRLAGRPIESHAGAMGLMQLMPGTWAEMRVKHGLGPDPHDPRDNILAGAAYLRAMHDRFGYPGLFAAYHAGPARYAEYLAGGRGLPAETVAYAAAVGSAPPPTAAHVRKESRQAAIFVSLVTVRQPVSEPGRSPVTSYALFFRLNAAAATAD